MRVMDLDRNIIEKIRKNVLGELFFFESVGSTNSEALKNPEAGDKSLFIAEDQTAGRGREDRRWEASEGGIYMTVFLKPERITENMPALTLAAGLAVSRVIENSMIKWPNDIILGNKKVAGILTEARSDENGAIIAVGIGINANNKAFSKELEDKAISIYIHTGKACDAADVIIGVYREFLGIYADFDSGFSKIADEYRKKCITVNREIKILRNGTERIMKATGISDKGELLAEADGKKEAISFGEVSVRGLLGYL